MKTVCYLLSYSHSLLDIKSWVLLVYKILGVWARFFLYFLTMRGLSTKFLPFIPKNVYEYCSAVQLVPSMGYSLRTFSKTWVKTILLTPAKHLKSFFWPPKNNTFHSLKILAAFIIGRKLISISEQYTETTFSLLRRQHFRLTHRSSKAPTHDFFKK